MNLSVIIPVYNEEDNVEQLFREIVQTLSEEPRLFEIVFIDDGSTDDTVMRLRELAAQDARLRVVCHQRNYGQSIALISGARAAKYETLVTMDGDGQNDPADIPHLCGLMRNNQTVVLGNRRKRNDNLIRRISSRVGNGIRRRLLADECSDTNCSLKIFPRDAFLRLPHFNHLHRFLPALFMRDGLTLINVPVNHRPRLHGVSKYGVMNRLFVGIHDLIGVRWLMKRPCLPEIISHE